MRLKKIVVVAGIILSLMPLVFFLSISQAKIIADKKLGNMNYLADDLLFSGDVALVHGQYEWNDTSKDHVFVSYAIWYTGQYVYGDFNHDGLKDAVVIYAENGGGSAEWYRVGFLINDGKKLVHRASGELCDRAIVNSLRQKNGKVFVDVFVHEDGDSMAGPTKHVKRIFEYRENARWIEGKELSAKSVFDPIRLVFAHR